MTLTRTLIFPACGLLLAGGAQAGDLSAPAAPNEPGSAMFTLQDLYQRLDTGAPGALRTGPFAAPTAGPGSTGYTLNDLMAKAPALDDATGAAPAEVVSGKTFWGLKAGAWGPQTGTMPIIGALSITPGTTSQAIPAGYHNGTGSVAGDGDLAPANIVSGVQIFGVTGTASMGSGATTAAVPKTGQTTSYTATAGEDGDLQHGVAWPTPRFTDNANGTVTDNLTGLIWLKKADCFGVRNWELALANANALANGQCGLTDGSIAGDWRLPNINELESLINLGTYYPALPAGSPFSGVQSDLYWSATTDAFSTSGAWIVSLLEGSRFDGGKTYSYYVWPVRGGQ